jgi:hypothetical protein
MADDELRGPIDTLLAPLATIEPAQRQRGHSIARRDRLIGVALSLIAVLLLTAATWATLELTSSAERSPVSPGQPLACLNLVGGSATHAEDVLGQQNLAIDWRIAVYQAPDGKTWTTTEVGSVAADAIVEDVARADATTVYVFVHHADDPYAPTATPPACPSP